MLMAMTLPEHRSRPDRDGRVVVLAFGSVAWAIRLAYQFWLQPVAWRWAAWVSLVAYLVPLLAFGVLCPVFWRVSRTAAARRTASFRLGSVHGQPAFVVPTSPWRAGPSVLVFLFVGGGAVLTERGPGDTVRIPAYGWIPSLVAVSLFVGLALWTLFRGPQVAITPDGLVVRRVRTRAVAWSALQPGGPVPTGQTLSLLFAQAPPTWFKVSLRWYTIDPVFLAGAVRHYVEHPGERASIGSAAGHERLRAALAGAPVSVTVR
jgi:hypothetical protein